MRTCVLGVLVSCGLFAAMGWKSFEAGAAATAGAATTGTLQSRASLTFDRLKRIPFDIVADVPVTVVFPANYGLVVERLQVDGTNGSHFEIEVNGVAWGKFFANNFQWATGTAGEAGVFDPPVVFRPGDSVTMRLAGGVTPGATYSLLMTAWEVGAGEV